MSRSVQYVGEWGVVLPSLNLEVAPGDILDVPDDFENPNFTDVPAPAKKGAPAPDQPVADPPPPPAA